MDRRRRAHLAPAQQPAARPRASAFADTRPRGFGLLQRDRVFDHYQDGVYYERRPSLWVEPLGDWGEGAVQLIEIPTDDEIHDNIVACWVPKAPAKAGSEPTTCATGCTGPTTSPTPRRWRAASRPASAAAASPASRGRQGVRKFMVEFLGAPLATLPFGVKPEAGARRRARQVLATSSPRPCRTACPATGARSSTSPPKAPEPVDLRLFLRNGEQTLSETWLYQFHPF